MNEATSRKDCRQSPVREPDQGRSNLVNLTEIFQQSLQQVLDPAGRASTVIRLDKLPVVTGNQSELEQLGMLLFKIIVRFTKEGNRLFLHVKCEQEPKEENVMDLRRQEGLDLFTIGFLTSVSPQDNWQLLFARELELCSLLATKNGGNFSFCRNNGSSCLFSLTFSGKPE